MRITFTVDAPFLGGAERYVERCASELLRRGVDVSILARTPGARDDQLAQWYARMEVEGVRVVTVPMDLLRRPNRCPGVVRGIRSLRPDLVHINVPGPYDGQNGLFAPLARACGCPVVTTEHLPMVEPLRKRALVRRVAYWWVARVITVCAANVAPLVKWHGVPERKVRVVANGIRDPFDGFPPRDSARRTLAVSSGELAIAYAGNILEHKGLYRLIEALALVSDVRWKLFVVGDGPDAERCSNRAGELGVSRRVEFLGRREPRDVAMLLAGCGVLALPSRVEGMPYVVLEAMAAGCAVVASPVAGIPEQVEDGVTGKLVGADDISGLSRAIALLGREPDACRRMGTAGRKRFEKRFTLGRQIDETLAVYREVLGDR